MTTSHSITLVLWGQGFDEIAASIFVAELRHLGKRVKLVGLNSQHIAGQHGVMLVPDLSLGQALRSANRIQCLIIPAPLAALQQFSYDPRLAELLEIAARNQTLFVINGIENRIESSDFAEASFLPRNIDKVLSYTLTEELLSFVRGPLQIGLSA